MRETTTKRTTRTTRPVVKAKAKGTAKRVLAGTRTRTRRTAPKTARAGKRN